MKRSTLYLLFLGLVLGLTSCDDSGNNKIATGPGAPGSGTPAITAPNAGPAYTWKDYQPLYDANGRVVFGIKRPNDPRGDSVLWGGRSFALASTFYLGRSIVREGEHQGGMINERGEYVLPLIHHKISGISDSGLVEIAILDSASGKVSEGVVNIDGQTIVPVEYDVADMMVRGKLIKVAKGKRYGLLDANGKELIPMQYSDIGDFQGGYAPIKKGGRLGLINEQGEIVVEPKYQRIMGFRNGVALIKEAENRYFIMDESFKNINGEYYQAFAAISYADPMTNNIGDNFGIPQDTVIRETFMTGDGNIAVAQENKWGVIGAAGDVIIPFENTRVGIKDGEWYGIK